VAPTYLENGGNQEFIFGTHIEQQGHWRKNAKLGQRRSRRDHVPIFWIFTRLRYLKNGWS